MAQVTIEVSDEIASRLYPYRDRLPDLLSRWATVMEAMPEGSGKSLSQPTAQVYQDIVSFLLSQPEPQSILDFKVSEAAQARLADLLDKNRSGQLSLAEVAALDLYEQLDQMMRMLKIQAFSVLNGDKTGSVVQAD